MEKGICPKCGKASGTLYLDDDDFACRDCVGFLRRDSCRLFEYGHENLQDPKGSTAHVRDIKNRRYDEKEKRSIYASDLGKTYFIPKGG